MRFIRYPTFHKTIRDATHDNHVERAETAEIDGGRVTRGMTRGIMTAAATLRWEIAAGPRRGRRTWQ